MHLDVDQLVIRLLVGEQREGFHWSQLVARPFGQSSQNLHENNKVSIFSAKQYSRGDSRGNSNKNMKLYYLETLALSII